MPCIAVFSQKEFLEMPLNKNDVKERKEFLKCIKEHENQEDTHG